MEKLVKGRAPGADSDKELSRKLTDLESALAQALDAVRTLGPMAEKKGIESTGDAMSSVPPELAQKVADRIKAAAEMGDVIKVASIAKELKTESEVLTAFC